jgi:hypothetical protein
MLRCNSVYESGESMLSRFACEGYDVRERETNRANLSKERIVFKSDGRNFGWNTG